MNSRIGTAGPTYFSLGISQVCDHLENMNVCKSVRPSVMHPRIMRELADSVAKPLSMILEKS